MAKGKAKRRVCAWCSKDMDTGEQLPDRRPKRNEVYDVCDECGPEVAADIEWDK